MKVFFILITLFLVSCSNEQKEKKIKEALLPLIESQSVSGKLKCELSFVKIHDDELSVYCLPVDKTDPLMADQLKREINKIVSGWSLSEDYKFKIIRTRFTDEIIAPIKK